MTRLRVATVIDAPPRRVWAELKDVGSHVRWMDDAVAIRFTTRRTSGVGTVFECDTRVGPLSTVDRMEIVEWKPNRAMAIRHVGLVRGEGRFTLRRARGGRTRFVWSERLQLPWWMAGPVGGAFARPILRRIFQRDVENLKRLVETTG